MIGIGASQMITGNLFDHTNSNHCFIWLCNTKLEKTKIFPTVETGVGYKKAGVIFSLQISIETIAHDVCIMSISSQKFLLCTIISTQIFHLIIARMFLIKFHQGHLFLQTLPASFRQYRVRIYRYVQANNARIIWTEEATAEKKPNLFSREIISHPSVCGSDRRRPTDLQK